MADAEFNLDVQTPSAAISEIAKGEQWPGTPSGGSSTQPSNVVHSLPRTGRRCGALAVHTAEAVVVATGERTESDRHIRAPAPGPRPHANRPRPRPRHGWAVPQAGGKIAQVTSCPYRPRGTPPLLRRCCVAHMAIGHSGFQYHLGCKRGSDPVSPAHDRRAAGARRRSSARVQLRAPSR